MPVPRADRLFVLVQLLGGPRFRSLAELARETGATPRTLYRDLADLEERGIPIERDAGRYRILTAAAVRPLPLTDRERMLLAVVLDHPALRRQPSYGRELTQLRRKLAAVHALPEPVAKVAGPERSGPIAPQVVEALERGIRDAHSVSILYTSVSSRQKKWRGVDPWLLLHRCDAWYLIGRCHTHDEPRTFRLDRIVQVLSIGTGFTRPANFDPEQWLAASWGIERGEAVQDVVVYFEPGVAALIEHAQHHPRESKRCLDDGTVEYRVAVSALDEMARWIVAFGGMAQATLRRNWWSESAASPPAPRRRTQDPRARQPW